MCICGPGDLRVEAQRDALFRLDLHHQHVVVERVAQRRRRAGAAATGSVIAISDVLCASRLPRAQVERHVGPAPVVDPELHRRVGLGVRVGPHVGLFAVARHRLAGDRARVVLSARRVQRHAGRLDRPDRAQHLELLVADRVGVGRDGRLHRDQREQVHHVVLDHVAQRAGVVVVAAAPLDADRLGRRDLHASRRSGGSRSARR